MEKTPDETKRALVTCTELVMPKEVQHRAMLDALAYIQQLEAANNELLTTVKQLKAKCHQLEQERDAAVADLVETKDCITCKHSANCKIGSFDCYHCSDKDCPCLTCQYVWRGVKEE